MNDTAYAKACEDIRRAKARYFRGVDTADTALVRDVLADDCVLDYMGCCTDPKTGHDYFPAMNIVMRGRENWSSTGLAAMGIVSVHHSHNGEIELHSETTASAIWSMTDRLFMPPGGNYAVMTGYGYYHETYEKIGGAWKIKTLRISRLRVEAI